MRSMTVFRAGDLVRVPYPHVERPVMVPRPALVVSRDPLGPGGLLLWTIMITNAERPSWPGDIAIPGSLELGLIVPSKLRTAKIAAVQAVSASRIGRLPPSLLEEVGLCLGRTLGL